MSALKWVQKNSRALAKGGLYVAGGLAIGYPLIRGAQGIWQGYPLDSVANSVVWEATGYSPVEHVLNTTQTRNSVIRTGIGALAIYAARKL